jgi:hypothetical protein
VPAALHIPYTRTPNPQFQRPHKAHMRAARPSSDVALASRLCIWDHFQHHCRNRVMNTFVCHYLVKENVRKGAYTFVEFLSMNDIARLPWLWCDTTFSQCAFDDVMPLFRRADMR